MRVYAHTQKRGFLWRILLYIHITLQKTCFLVRLGRRLLQVCQIQLRRLRVLRGMFKKIVYCSQNCGCSADVLCFVPNTTELSAFLYCTLFADRFFDYMVAGSKGTKMPRGDKQQIMTYSVPNPDPPVLERFNNIAHPILQQMDDNRFENSRLAGIRDSLLPKLMSGELDVSSLDL